MIACLNTCIGLFSCCSEYFSLQWPKIPYKAWVVIFAVISFFVSIAGLDTILAISVPILSAIYPVAIVLIALGLAHRITGKAPLCYPVAVAFTILVSVPCALVQAKLLGGPWQPSSRACPCMPRVFPGCCPPCWALCWALCPA